jgi:nicotinamidase-related amidase
VAYTSGAALQPQVVAALAGRVSRYVRKGMHGEAYSAFDGTGLADVLRDWGVSEVLVCGVATDYCVRATALDSLRFGFRTVVLRECVAAVDVTPGDGERALAEVRAAGGEVR